MSFDQKRAVSKIYQVIVRNRDLDPVSLAEKIAERVEYLLEDEEEAAGLAGSVEEAHEQAREVEEPSRFQQGKITPRPRSAPVVENPGPPPVPKSRMIAMPGDPEFEKAKKLTESDKITPTRITKVGSATTEESTVAYWTMETLIRYLEQNFPPSVAFTPDGLEETIKVKAGRNIQAMPNQYGHNGVRITYAHEGVNQDGMDFTNMVGDGVARVNISPIASHLFSCGEQNIDVEGVKQKLWDQLCGLYSPRKRNMEPGYIGEPGIDSWNANQRGMSDSDSIRATGGWQEVGSSRREVTLRDGSTVSVADPLPGNVDHVVSINRSVGTPGAVK